MQQQLLQQIALFIAGLLFLLILCGLIRAARPKKPDFLSRLAAKKLMTDNETEFFLRLTKALPDYYVFPQVAFTALLKTKGYMPFKDWSALRNKFNRLVADYVICDRTALQVEAVVELDDSTHDRKKEKDAARDAMLQAAGYRTERFRLRIKSSEREIADIFARKTSRSFGALDRDIAERYLAQTKEPKLHIGCGDNLLAGWLNADYFPASGDIMHIDATQPFPFKDGTFDYIFSEHMIEHISYNDGVKMLAECRRTLKPSGTLRISTPDLAFLLGLARPDKSELQRAYIKWAARTFIAGAPEDNAAFVINNFVRDWGHTFLYDENTLRKAMTTAGFTKITKRTLQESESPSLRNLENETRMPAGFLQLETLTLEGRTG